MNINYILDIKLEFYKLAVKDCASKFRLKCDFIPVKGNTQGNTQYRGHFLVLWEIQNIWTYSLVIRETTL